MFRESFKKVSGFEFDVSNKFQRVLKVSKLKLQVSEGFKIKNIKFQRVSKV